jgi:hypothetical protein
VGHDPLTGESLNVIEQINQTFTILLSLRAVESLIEMHPKASGFRLALATTGGFDIESVKPDLVAATVFSAHPSSTQRFKKDMARLTSYPARHRYMFFAAPKCVSGRQAPLETAPWVEVNCVTLLDGEDSGKNRTWLERVNCILIAKAACFLRNRYPTNQLSKHPFPAIALESPSPPGE